MLSLISTLGGLLISGLPKLLEYFQNKADQAHELRLADKAVIEKASTWVANYIGTVRPTVTYIFVFELVAINGFLCYYLWQHPGLITSMDDVLRYADIIFSPDEMAMLGGIIGFWFGSRNWGKK
jgi:hypothetical protein